MKKIHFLYSLSLLLLISSFVFATPQYDAVWDIYCPDECIEGREVEFDVEIENEGSSTFIIKYIEFRDRDGTPFAGESVSNVLTPGEEETFSKVSGYLPEPTSGSKLYYKLYFYVDEVGSTEHDGWLNTKENSMKVTRESDVECDHDYQCAKTHECEDHECVDVSCGDCEYISNHKCEDYECCEDEDCDYNERCEGHECEKIICPEGYVSDHECVEHECTQDSDCEKDDYCKKNDCISLGCAHDEYASNHQCIKYDCMENSNCNSDEYCKNHNCVKLSCLEDEYISDHQCIKHECMNNDGCESGEYCSDHNCVNWDSNLTGYIAARPSVGGLIIIIIGAVAVIVFWLYKKKKKSGGFSFKSTKKSSDKPSEKPVESKPKYSFKRGGFV